jgi:hypothetical protein
LRKEEKHAVATHIIGPHSVVSVDTWQAEDIAIEGGSPVEIGNIEGCFKNTIELGHSSRSCNPFLTCLVFPPIQPLGPISIHTVASPH